MTGRGGSVSRLSGETGMKELGDPGYDPRVGVFSKWNLGWRRGTCKLLFG